MTLASSLLSAKGSRIQQSQAAAKCTMISHQVHIPTPRQQTPTVDARNRLQVKVNGRRRQAILTINTRHDRAPVGLEVQASQDMARTLMAISTTCQPANMHQTYTTFKTMDVATARTKTIKGKTVTGKAQVRWIARMAHTHGEATTTTEVAAPVATKRDTTSVGTKPSRTPSMSLLLPQSLVCWGRPFLQLNRSGHIAFSIVATQCGALSSPAT